jgi:hypothetical protein
MTGTDRTLPARRSGGFLAAEIVPDPWGAVSFGILVLVLAAYLSLGVGSGGIASGLLAAWGIAEDARIGAVAEGFVQALLLVLPPACAYAGIRHLLARGDSLLPCFTVAGGGFVTVLNAAAVFVAILSS